MKAKILTGVALCSIMTLNAKSVDPVLMTVNGKKVPVSEFRYLFNKNLRQQIDPQTIDEYLEMFEIYRLKVEDAKAAGKDTTAAFIKEMKQYRAELLQPFLTDSAMIYDFIDIAVNREGEEVEASHIMMSKTRDIGENLALNNKLDSIRNELIKGADFSELAKKFSHDKSVINNNGYLGFIAAGRFPYAFETAVFETPEGKISEIVESPVGYHIVKAGERRPSRGKIEVAHIMKIVPKDATPEIEEDQKRQIDSIYYVLKKNPGKFGELARKLSDDKSSARQDGNLREFGSGEMVPEFENAAFALKVGEISEPVRSNYGWHIILKRGEKPARTYSEIKEDVIKKIANPQDGRFLELRKKTKDNLTAKHGVSLNESVIKEMKNISRGRLDSMIYANWTQLAQPVATVADKPIPAANISSRLSKINETRPEVVEEIIDQAIDSEIMTALINAEEEWQLANNEEFSNLIKEYTDGSMLYEISVEKVWDKAAKDQEGLENYFNRNKEKYKWDQPYAKGLLVQAVNQSVADEIKAATKGCDTDSIINIVKSRFGNKAVVEKFIIPKGINAMVDNLMFDGPSAAPKNKNMTSYFIMEGRLISEPEEMSDVKGSVITDYQEELEKEWIKEMREKYPVILNKKEFQKLKKAVERGE